MIQKIKSMNRALLELLCGILFLGILISPVGVLLLGDALSFLVPFWVGVALAAAGALHIYRTLYYALDLGPGAEKKVSAGYYIRYMTALIIFVLEYTFTPYHPLISFLGLILLKVAAYVQPLTHKFFNWIFHETDPIPEPLSEAALEEISTETKKEYFR